MFLHCYVFSNYTHALIIVVLCVRFCLVFLSSCKIQERVQAFPRISFRSRDADLSLKEKEHKYKSLSSMRDESNFPRKPALFPWDRQLLGIAVAKSRHQL